MRKLSIVLFAVLLTMSCEETSRSTHTKLELDQIVNDQARAMILSGLGRYSNGGGFSSLSGGGPVRQWFFLPWSFGGGPLSGAVANVTGDTSYYDPETGYWTFEYDYPGYTGLIRYKFEPHDSEGDPTEATDQFLFESSFTGSFTDSFTNIGYTFDGTANYAVSGFKDYSDPAKSHGELVFNGNSNSNYRQTFAPDTTVLFTYSEKTDNVRLRKQDCFPHSGKSEYAMVQDATPDTFTWSYLSGWTVVDSTSGDTVYFDPVYTVSYEDFSFIGRTVFTETGIHFVIDGEDYFYEATCGNGAGGPVGLGRSMKKNR